MNYRHLLWAVGLLMSLSAASISAAPVYLPLVSGAEQQAQPLPASWLGRVNGYRALAGIGPVTEDVTLDANCVEHARFMAENDALTHDQNDPQYAGKPFKSVAGQSCAKNSNVFLGSGSGWSEADAIDSWMESVGHRCWLLYPTTPTFGFGMAASADGSAEGVALDVLSRSMLSADTSYSGWPVRYPVSGQLDVPTGSGRGYPITLVWRYFGTAPTIGSTRLRAVGGADIVHSADTSLPAGHKGIELMANNPLRPNTTYEVQVSGSYGGAPFSYTWQFTTGA